jgi:hypothetical protein
MAKLQEQIDSINNNNKPYNIDNNDDIHKNLNQNDVISSNMHTDCDKYFKIMTEKFDNL